MFAISPVATASTAISVSPSVLAPSASDAVSTRVTPVALAAPLSNTSVQNEASGTATVATPAATAGAQSAAAAVVASAADSAVTASAGGPSSTFLAQLISQNEDGSEDNQIALASSYAGFAPAPSYTTFISFGIVKYRPSDAGLPSAYAPPASAAQNDSAPVVAPANDYNAYSATQTRNQSNLISQQPQLVVAG